LQTTESDLQGGTEDKILHNALRHFCEFGYNGTSVREITAASDVTKPTLYYYFKNKEELFTKLANTCFSFLLSVYDHHEKSANTFREGILSIFNAADELYTRNQAALRFVYGLAVAPQRGTPDVGFNSFLNKLDDRIRVLVENAVSKGECKKDKAEVMVTLISGLRSLYLKDLLSHRMDSKRRGEIEIAIDSVLECNNLT
jgi:AcrR family transcriptional regulator